MNKIEEIFKSWRIAMNGNDAQIALACKRIEICDECENKETLAVGPVEFVTRCNVCGCALKSKIYTPKVYSDDGGSCPKGFWEKVEREYLESKDKPIEINIDDISN